MSKYDGLAASEVYRLGSSAASINADVIHAGETVVKGIIGRNASGVDIWLKLFDQSDTPDPSAGDEPRLAFCLPDGPFALDFGYGVIFRAGLGMVLVTGAADTNETAVAAGDILGLNITRA